MRCDEISESLSAVAAATVRLPRDEQVHVEHCLRCQAEVVQHRRVLRLLRAMRTEILEPAPGLLSEIFAAIEEAGEQRAIRSLLQGRRAAYVGGLAAATAAGAAGALAISNLSRRHRIPLAG